MEFPNHFALSPELQEAVTSRGSINIYKMVTHSPGLAPGFFMMADAIFQANSLPPQLRELSIIRVGRRYNAPYEIHYHEMIGRAVGLEERAITAAATGNAEDLTTDEAAILRWTDTLIDEHDLSDTEREASLEVLTVTQLADLVLTVGFYQLVCNFLNTFRVEIDHH